MKDLGVKIETGRALSLEDITLQVDIVLFRIFMSSCYDITSDNSRIRHIKCIGFERSRIRRSLYWNWFATSEENTDF